MPDPVPARARPRGAVELVVVVLVGALAVRVLGFEPLGAPALRVAATVFVAVNVQALPFLVLGVLLSAALAAFVTPAALRRVVPARPVVAVPVAVACGAVLPGCECASVPVARRLVGQGVPAPAALAFLLAAPAVNPVVVVATAVAFPAHPEVVVARVLASGTTAVVVGWTWARIGRPGWTTVPVRRPASPGTGRTRWAVFTGTACHDLVDAAGFLVLGGLTAAVLAVAVPGTWTDGLAARPVLAVAVLAVLAVVLALCSEADAFVAASLAGLPLLPRLVLLVVGPAVDVKLIALQAGAFGRAFVVRFAPLTFVVAVASAVGVGSLVLGGAG